MNKKEELDHLISEFLRDKGIHKVIAFSGGSNTELGGVPEKDPLQLKYKELQQEYERRIVGDCIGKFRGHQVAILTGGTKWGVPQTAAIKAKEFGLPVIGIYPLTGQKHALGKEMLDFSFCVEPHFGESRWGDESPIFANLLDGVIVIGGGAGTLIECAHILKINEQLIKNDLSPKYIVPMSTTGGVAEGLPFVWAKQNIRTLCMPPKRIETGLEAANFLVEKLNLHDYVSE